MSRLKTIVRNQHGVQPLRGGHSLCQGCGIPMVVRTVLGTIRQPAVVVNATGCLEVATTRFPTTAWNVPWLHVAFENAAAVASGVESAQRALRRRHALPAGEEVAVVVFAGDGGTYDIGLQVLSGALERGHRFLFVCYDNEAYMNTGVQRSGATPFGARAVSRASPSADGRGGPHRGGSLSRVRRPTGAGAVRHRLPGGRRRPGLRRGHCSRRSRDSRTHHLCRERPRRDLRARLPGRGALPAGLRPDPRGTAADRDRRAPALCDRVGLRKRRGAAPGGRRSERQARRRRGRRARQGSLRLESSPREATP